MLLLKSEYFLAWDSTKRMCHPGIGILGMTISNQFLGTSPSHTPSMMNPSIGLRRACRQELYSGEAGALMMLGPLAMDFECFLV